MKKISFIQIVFIGVAFMLSSCSSYYTRGSLYSKFYEEMPTSILVMPPINNTTNVEAKELLYTSISQPLIEAGYYVVSPHLSMELLKAESAYDSEMFIDKNASVFRDVFGVDAVVFSIIDIWSKRGFGIDTKITYKVVSTTTNEVLFERTCDLYLDLQQNSGSSSILNQIADLAISAISTATTDHIVAARKCNYYIFKDIPRGKYNSQHLLDKETPASDRNTRVTVR